MNKPFMLRPAAVECLWGGSRLNDEFNYEIPLYPLGEAWVCSTHPDGPSTVADADTDPAADSLTAERTDETESEHDRKVWQNKRRGKEPLTLPELLRNHPEYLGTHPLAMTDGVPELPILIKLIDARADLSVQVHPDDAYAIQVEGERGKTEMWYVLGARKDSELVYGFKEDMDPEKVRRALREGSVDRYLNHVPVRKNDVFYIEAGTVHAIGAGCLIAEIQENSNITYRLYDYDRTDRRGRKRKLHVDRALDVADLSSSEVPRQPVRVLKYRNGSASELLTRCKYFQVERLLLNTEGRTLADFRTGPNSFHALLCVDGCGVLYGEDIMLPFFKGDCIFVPADSAALKLHGRARILDVSC